MNLVPTPTGECRAPLIPWLACILVASAPFASAQPANAPLEEFVTTDGIVYAITKTNDVIYFGGSFTSVGLRTGGGVPVSATTGQKESVYPGINGTVSAAIADGQGGWYLGGVFTRAGGLPRTNLVHIRSDRSVDPDWRPSAIGGYVGSLALAGDTLYLGGFFTNVNGQTRNRLAALDTTSGALRAWNPDANAEVRTLAIDGSTVYAGGEFTQVSSLPRSRIAAIDATSGAVTSWNPGADDSVEALVVSGGRLFVGGFFGTIATQPRSRVASFSLGSGTLENWNPGVGTVTILSPAVYKIAVQGNTVFIAGAFSTLGTSNRVNIGAVDATTGITTAWDAHADLRLSSGIPTASIQGMELYSNVLYVGGILVNIGGQPRGYAAALDTTTGQATAWNPDPNSIAIAFSGVGNSIFIGGLFSTLGGVSRTNLAAFNVATRQVTPWNPTATNNVLALLVTGDRVYVGGEFHRVNGVIRSNLAAVDMTSGALLPWNPSPNLYVIALAQWNDRLYVGGGFTNINGAGRTNIAEFNLSTGTLTAWSPVLNRAQVRVLTVSGNTLYAGGLISTVDGVARRRIAAFDLPSGALSPWNPDITSSGGVVEAIVPLGDRVYIGGRFTAVAGQPRTNLFAVDATTAQLLSWTAHTDSPVVAIAPTTNIVFVAGDFQNIGGQTRNYCAALDAATGAVTAWNPNPDFFLRKLLLEDGILYTGGGFMRMGGQTGRGIAAFSLSSVTPPVIEPASLVRLGDGRFQFQFSAPNSTQATVWGSTNLTTWQNLQNVPVSNGEGQFIDTAAPGHPGRFYRVSVP